VGGLFRDVFVDNYDGAGRFTDLVQFDRHDGSTVYVDSLDTDVGFDAVCILHVRVVDETARGSVPDELSGPPEVHYCLSDEYISGDDEVREDVRRRGILARYFKDYVRGEWLDGDRGHCYDAVSVVGVQSRIGSVVMQNAFLRFYGDRWMEIPINARFAVKPGGVFYVGTLTVELSRNSYDELIGSSRLTIVEDDLNDDISFFQGHFPNLFEQLEGRVVVAGLE
jgi:hypothetical protein